MLAAGETPASLYRQTQSPKFLATSAGLDWRGAFFADVSQQENDSGSVTTHQHVHLCIQYFHNAKRVRPLGRTGAWQTRGVGLRVSLPGDETNMEAQPGPFRNQFLFVTREHAERVLGEPLSSRPFALYRGRTLASEFACSVMTALSEDIRWGSPAGRVVAQCQITALLSWLAAQGDAQSEASRGSVLCAKRLARLSEYVDAHLGHGLCLTAMAEAVGLNLRQLRNGLLRATGKTPQRFVQERRIALAKSLIGSTAQTLAEIAAASGFADQAHMSRLFQREIGVAPSVWRAQIR